MVINLFHLFKVASLKLFLIFFKNKKNIYLFGSAFGYKDNAKYLFVRAVKERYKEKIYWVAKDYQEFYSIKSKGLPVVLIWTREWLCAVANCNTCFFTHDINDVSPILSLDTTAVNLWHGTPIKFMGYDSAIDLKRIEKRKKLFLKPTYERWDFLICTNHYMKNCMASATRIEERKIFFSSQPRNTVLKESTAEENIVTYMPTFRDNDYNEHILNMIDIWPDIYKETNYKLCIKLHPMDRNQQLVDAVKGDAFCNFLDLSEDGDQQILLAKTNILITDYSSVIFDFLSTGRKIILFCPDYDSYVMGRGGMYISFEEIKQAFLFADSKESLSRVIVKPAVDNKWFRLKHSEIEGPSLIERFFS